MATHTYSLVASYVSGGQFAQNVLHYQFDDAGFSDTAAAALALCNAFDTANTTHLKNLLPTSVNIASYRARNLVMGGGFEAVKVMALVPGLRAGNMQVSAVSPVAVLFPTGNAKPRGRVFIPGATDNDLIDGEWTSTFRADFVTHGVMFTNTFVLTGGGGPTASPVVFSRKTSPGSSYLVEYVRLSDMPGTQRRRQRPA
jgi:hypothetical protein